MRQGLFSSTMMEAILRSWAVTPRAASTTRATMSARRMLRSARRTL